MMCGLAHGVQRTAMQTIEIGAVEYHFIDIKIHINIDTKSCKIKSTAQKYKNG